jgi:hypothetical protein
MPPPCSPTPARRRLTFKRVLLALVLGLVAWWGLAWWTYPRPLYTKRYPGHLDSDKHTDWFRGLLQAQPLDAQGTYLVVLRPEPSLTDRKLEVVETGTGTVVTSYHLPDYLSVPGRPRSLLRPHSAEPGVLAPRPRLPQQHLPSAGMHRLGVGSVGRPQARGPRQRHGRLGTTQRRRFDDP